ncbi:VOC family protein [Oxynema aestuarii]|jgi:glyoxylase I family protein|uniref:Glyoxalase n=1 Tax=Oxynema aestuarii AP17 TaxID=2064643 RepID=A0A6H1TSC1_9CYAN|nr:VOC family protein [Oxynema aestuarii]QIZ69441.1 glyoxalase [Oxynema aestuarii AP17]RMH73133.1 MAG: glyoxalase [Cyanobacteria bacterium J007]
MEITEYLHTALLVSDLDRAENFYSNILGLPKVERVLKFPGVWYQIGSFQLHLIVDSQAHTELNHREKWGRNAHVAFCVADVEAAKQKLVEAGYEVQMSASGRAALFTRDPDGNVVELSQRS